MQIPNIILSINIPTYDRPQEFERMLKGLIPQLNSNIEIVVRDDSPNLKTQEIFNQIFPQTGFLYQYHKGEKIGVDSASLFLLEKAQGEFVWFLSDDDELLEGAVAEVLRLIQSDPELNLIWANFITDISDGPSVPNRPAGYFKDGSEVLEVLDANIGLISTQIYRREKGLSGIERAKKHVIGFGFVSTAIYIHVLSQPGKFYFLKGPYLFCHPTTNEEVKKIMTRTGKIVNEAFNIYGINFYNIIKDYENSFTKKAVRKILSKNFSYVWRGILVGWIGGWDTPKGKLWRMFKIYWSYPEFWLALPAFSTPLCLNRALYKVYKVFFHERKFILFQDVSKSQQSGK